MADSFVDPIVDKIFKACSVYLKDQYRWQRGMKEELERLRENHSMIRAVVSAYTRAQIRDRYPELNSWIWKLRDAIDEADDVLDDFEYEKLEEQLTRNKKQQKVVKKIGKRALKMDPNLKRLEKVVKKLDKVSAEVSTFLPFLENAKQEQELQLCKDRETGCLPKNVLIGRGEEKDFVMQWLRKPTNQDPTHIASPTLYKNISLLSIVGHGGMGKTTLLQYIYEDLKEEFELKMWVCVSNHFDAKKVLPICWNVLTRRDLIWSHHSLLFKRDSFLKHLDLCSIPLLKSLPDLPSSLKSLSLDSIPLFKSLPELPPSLYSLSLGILKTYSV